MIETPRLILSDFENRDFASFSNLFESLEQAGQKWFNVRASKPESVHAFFNQIIGNQTETPRQTYRLAIRLKDAVTGTPQLIGYVSLCQIQSHSEGTPDTGVLIDPLFQRDGFAREARLAIGHFAMSLGIERLFCDVKINNVSSTNNVLAMGYEQAHHNGVPVVIKTQTLDGIEDWYRYRISRSTFLDHLPVLLDRLSQRHWRPNGVVLSGDKTQIDDIIRISIGSGDVAVPIRRLKEIEVMETMKAVL